MPAPFVTHLEGAIDGAVLPADGIQTTHEGRPLWVRFDMASLRRTVDRDALVTRPSTMWRYHELLPHNPEGPVVTLGEGITPLLPCPRLGEAYGFPHLWMKDESQLPTGSFKSRGQAMAITLAKEFGVEQLAIPTNGNAGGAMAAYAARAGMDAYVFMPANTPKINPYECITSGAKTYFVDGYITDCGRIVREGTEHTGWFDMSTLKEPYRLEGKKTMGLELAEQLGWRLPDVILYPTGGGTGLIGMWKAFQELAALGWLENSAMPKMVAVQSDGCAPIVRAFEQGERFAEPFPDAHTVASGIRVPAAVGDFMILDAVRESGGTAVAVPEARILNWMREACSREGIAVCPESGACVGALEILKNSGWLSGEEHVVIFNTGAVQKYPEAMAVDVPVLDANGPIDWDGIG